MTPAIQLYIVHTLSVFLKKCQTDKGQLLFIKDLNDVLDVLLIVQPKAGRPILDLALPKKILPLGTKGLRSKAESKAFSTRRARLRRAGACPGTSRLNMDPKIFFGKYSTIDIIFNKIFGPKSDPDPVGFGDLGPRRGPRRGPFDR